MRVAAGVSVEEQRALSIVSTARMLEDASLAPKLIVLGPFTFASNLPPAEDLSTAGYRLLAKLGCTVVFGR